jgi:hypothetical protein
MGILQTKLGLMTKADRISRFFLLAALSFFCFLLLKLSLPYTAMRPNIAFLRTKQNVYHIGYWRHSFYIHVFTSIIVLLAGFTQFSRTIMTRYPRIHRIMGWIYFITVVFVSGPAAMIMAWYANGHLPARISFTILAILWIGFTFLAGWFAIRRRFRLHGDFMIRSYALTLSAITLRAYTFISAFLPIDAKHIDIYIATAWLSWVPNLIVAEILIYRRHHRLHPPLG